MNKKSSYDKLKCKYNMACAMNEELKRLIFRFGTDEENEKLQEIIKKYVHLVDIKNL